ncbi:hypothetical protein ACFO0U_02495 [Chromohalobacter sarecensis]|uniref:Uncharacterized protein n=1 Tax=Chromohalobacter sarecensis TaxID=245294 RepID=A0ABV9CWJ8_9GAMM|nr:hypothetical protein [Chromohalobacter sarecensis]MCK0714790.1 hypothetical protein [Chromohalobacter sarecensis]
MRNDEQYRNSDQAEHEKALKVIYMPAMPPLGLFVWSKKTLRRLLEKVRA